MCVCVCVCKEDWGGGIVTRAELAARVGMRVISRMEPTTRVRMRVSDHVGVWMV